MKKFFRFLPLLLIPVFAYVLTACSDDDDKDIAPDNLPATAQAFLDTYYNSVKIVNTVQDKNEYEVVLANGHRIDFDKAGEWTEVDAPQAETIPTGFYPAAIDNYLEQNYKGIGINEISRDSRGYDVELVNGVDLDFNVAGEIMIV